MGKNKSKNKTRSGETPRKQALAVTEGDLARIEAQEQSAKLPKPRKVRKLSGLDAAAKVLFESKEPLASQDIVKAMGQKGYWKSPGGKTPHATIYAAMAREISEKGKASRFKKVDRGMFAANK
jgi:hypothetical protein